MSTSNIANAADHIVPLSINGLDGRMLYAESENKKHQREILLVYGHHAMLERWWGLVENLREYGNVTMPDLPGFGGMNSFYTIGRKPTLDNYADYLAAFIKLKYKKRKFSIYAISFGFVVVTRMLQRYPEMAKNIDILVSAVGFVHHDDIIYKPRTKKLFKFLTRLFGTRLFSLFIRYFCLNKFVLKNLYAKMPNSKRRMLEVGPEEFDITMDFEVKLWQANDVRTHWITTCDFFKLDNCQVRIDLPIIHIVSKEDHYFDNRLVEQHLKVVYKKYTSYTAHSKAHTPSVLADKAAMAIWLPAGLKRSLAKRSK